MSICCELGTRPYSENQLVNKEDTVFLLPEHTVSAHHMYPLPSPHSLYHSGADACRQHLPDSHVPRLQSGSRHREALVGSRRETEARISFALVIYLCCCYSTSSVVPTSSKGHAEHGPR